MSRQFWRYLSQSSPQRRSGCRPVRVPLCSLRFRMYRSIFVSAVLGLYALALSAQDPSVTSFERPLRIIDSIPAPESVAIGPDGAWYISSFGKFGVKGDGAVYRVDPEKGTREIFAPGLDDPCGVLFVGKTLWAADREGVYRVTAGKVELVYPATDFPRT